jgi:2-polyprenyl-6-methoxyphenol hydroxylase-like FAD-dependent oxidoreductase
MGANRCRWSFQIGSPEAHTTQLDGLNGFIRERAPWFSPARGEILWASMVQFDRRLAGGMGADRLWLAGDAVHMTSPVGVQSMNAGLVDAAELSWRLGDLLIGDRGPDVLGSYSAERMRELSALIRPDGTQPPEGAAEWVVKRWPEVSSSIPATGEALAALTAQLGSGR